MKHKLSEILNVMEEEFFILLEKKTGWGKEQLKLTYKQAELNTLERLMEERDRGNSTT